MGPYAWTFLHRNWDLTLIGSKIDAQEVPGTPNREEVIRVFKKAIELNEDFKNTVKTIPFEEHQSKRATLEQYHEDVLSPKLADCVKLLSSGNDGHLAVEFFKLLISYENSASEEFSFALGETFLNNPSLIEATLPKFTTSERKFLYGKLKWGWENVIYEKDKSDRRIVDLSKRLERLKSAIGN
jgi:hypothetical protein